MEKIKQIALLLFQFLIKYKIKSYAIAGVLNGIGTGIIANIMFVITTNGDISYFSLTISFIVAIIILLVANLERKDNKC